MLTAHPAHISVIGFNHLSRASLLGFPVVPTLNLVTDANGNLVTGDGLYREYNSLNQLLNIRNGSDSSAPLLQQFVYNPIEERVDIKKTFNNSGTVVETVYYWSKSFVTVENLTGQYNFTYDYHENQIIAQEVQGTKLFIHGDVEGSSSVITNSTGQVVERTEYDAYGNIISGGTKTRFGYDNKEADSVVGDTDFNFRKYKSEWGLFTQPDTLIQNVYDPQTLNRYMFERGNPYKYTDPDGHFWNWLINLVLEYGPEITNFLLNKIRRDAALKIAEKINEEEAKENEEETDAKNFGEDQKNDAPTDSTQSHSIPNSLWTHIPVEKQNILIQNMITRHYSLQITDKQIETLREGGSVRTKDNSVVTTIPNPSTGESEVVVIKPVSKPSQKRSGG